MTRNTWPLSFRKSTVVASIRVRSGSPFCVDFKATIHLTLNFAIFTIKAADMSMVYKYYEKS